MIRLYFLLSVIAIFTSSFDRKSVSEKETNLVKSNTWFIAGPVIGNYKYRSFKKGHY
ncbi:hypothetical protein D3C86_972940 [compost metagenome]